MKDLLSFELAQSDSVPLCEVLKKIKYFLELREIPNDGYTSQSLSAFGELPGEKRRAILKNLEQFHEILLSVPDKARAASCGLEKEYVAMAFQKFNLKLAPGNDLSFVESGDLIEIYNNEGIQLYRNLEFFKQCSYDLLSLVNYEWHVLYERAQAITDAILDTVTKVLQEGKSTRHYAVPLHTLRERHLDAKNVFSVQMKYICPLVDSETGLTAGFIHTVESKLISSGQNSDKIIHL